MATGDDEVEQMRARLREAIDACTTLGMDQAVLILENHRLRRQLERAKGDSSKIENESCGPHAADNGTWSPKPDADGNLTLGQAVGQALGYASTCWVGSTEHLEFDGTKAMLVHDGLMAFLSDWADHVRKQANEATEAKMLAKEHWTNGPY